MIDHAEVKAFLDQIPAARRREAADFHDAAEAALKEAGYTVAREVHAPTRNRYNSRIDLVLNGTFAVELDRRTPRRSSLRKIEAFGAGMVYCRDPYN